MTVSFGGFGTDRDREALKGRMLRSARALKGASRETRDGLAQLARLCRLRRGARLTTQTEVSGHVYLLACGRVVLERHVDRGILPLGHFGKGDFVGPVDLADPPLPATSMAKVVEDVQALALAVGELRELAARDAAVREAIRSVAVERVCLAEQRLEALLLNDVESRLAAFLLYMTDRWGVPSPEGIVLATAIKHHEIARMLGTGREWVTVTILKLRRRRVLGALGRRLVVRNVEMLRTLAGR